MYALRCFVDIYLDLYHNGELLLPIVKIKYNRLTSMTPDTRGLHKCGPDHYSGRSHSETMSDRPSQGLGSRLCTLRGILGGTRNYLTQGAAVKGEVKRRLDLAWKYLEI